MLPCQYSYKTNHSRIFFSYLDCCLPGMFSSVTVQAQTPFYFYFSVFFIWLSWKTKMMW